MTEMTDYSVTIEVLIDGHSWLDERIDDTTTYAQLDQLLDALTDLHGVVSGDGRGWSATVTVDAPNPEEAQTLAINAVRSRASAAGLPDRPVVRVEVVRGDVLDAELSRSNLPELVSGPEVAVLLGVNRQRVHQLAHAHPDFPEPLYRLGVGSLWDRHAIERFSERWERKPGRPRKQATEAVGA